MSTEACIIRPAHSLEEAHNVYWPLMQSLGWTRASEDCKTHWISTGPDAFLVVGSTNNPDQAEGCIVPFVFTNSTGWIGFFCINEPHRRKGWGKRLFQAALDHFKSQSVEVVGLDAVTAQVGTYARRGFIEKGLVRVLMRDSTKNKPIDGLAYVEPGKVMVDLEHIPESILVRSDLEHSGLQRSRLWTKEALFNRQDTFGFALVDEEKGHEKLDGWVLVRGCQVGFRLGPLYAKTPEIAASLLRTVLKRVEDHEGKFIAELWAGNVESERVFAEAGFSSFVVHYHRMWLNGNLPEAQKPGGKADKEVYATFDAGEG